MILNELIPGITGTTEPWNIELGKLMDIQKDYINLAYTDMFTLDSPLLTIKVSDRQLKRLLKKSKLYY